MKTCFLCGNLEPGRDGVGDYARRLAGELIRQGHDSMVISLCDQTEESNLLCENGAGSCNRLNSLNQGPDLLRTQVADGTPVSVRRIASSVSWSQRQQRLERIIEEYDPTWLSLQFVPYSFAPKGLPVRLPRVLNSLTMDRRWHVMIHEMPVGLNVGASLKQRALGRLQSLILKTLHNNIRPKVIHSHCGAYLAALANAKVQAKRLPLFPNIAVEQGDGWPILHNLDSRLNQQDQFLLAGVFGTIHAAWPAEKVLEEVYEVACRVGKQAVFISIGKSGCDSVWFDRLRQHFHGRVRVLNVGQRSEADVSRILQTLDVGLAASPWQLIEKSASVSTMRGHGLPVVVSRDDWQLKSGASVSIQPEGLFRTVRDATDWSERCVTCPSLRDVAAQFVIDLEQ